MPRCREDLNKWSNKDFRRLAIKFFISPIWLVVEMFSWYTHVSQFLLSNLAFFHCAVITPLYGMITIQLYCGKLDNPDRVLLPLLGFIFIYAILLVNCREFAKFLKPSVQYIHHMIFGLLGMILSVWAVLVSFILMDFKFDLIISTCVLYSSLIALGFSYILFKSALTTLYVQLPEDKMPFSGVKSYVVFFAVLHVGVAVAAVCLSKNWPICQLLVVSSFIFCCDAWSCIFTDRYMLCLHRKRKFETRTVYPTDWVIHRVAVKRFSKQICPKGFQFDEDLFNEDADLWIRYDHSVENQCFWI